MGTGADSRLGVDGHYCVTETNPDALRIRQESKKRRNQYEVAECKAVSLPAQHPAPVPLGKPDKVGPYRLISEYSTSLPKAVGQLSMSIGDPGKLVLESIICYRSGLSS